MTFIQTWTKHLTEQILNAKAPEGFDSVYSPDDHVVLRELFFMLLAAIAEGDYDAECAYYYVCKDFIISNHFGIFDTVLTDAKKEADYDEPSTQRRQS